MCDTALVYGFADQKKTIDVDLIEEVVKERMESSVVPLLNVEKPVKTYQKHDNDFPWINPDGGTEGLKPAAEKKNVKKSIPK